MILLYEILNSFPKEAFATIKWSDPVEFKMFKQELDQIADDILRGSDNTLAV